MSAILAYLAGAVVAVWGVAHAVAHRADGRPHPVVWFKICPVLLAGSAVLLVAASLLSVSDLPGRGTLVADGR